MTDDNFGSDYYITSWEDFEEDCKELGWPTEKAQLTPIDEYLADGITALQANNLQESAKRYGLDVWQQVQNALKIKPHKGGRTARVEMRITPEKKSLFRFLAEARGISHADLLEEMIDNYWDERYVGL